MPAAGRPPGAPREKNEAGRAAGRGLRGLGEPHPRSTAGCKVPLAARTVGGPVSLPGSVLSPQQALVDDTEDVSLDFGNDEDQALQKAKIRYVAS